MDLRRIRYTIALLCLVTTIVLITYKLTADQKWAQWTSAQVSEWTGEVQSLQQWSDRNIINSDTRSLENSKTREDLTATIISSPQASNAKQVMQWPNPYLLIDDNYLIPLSTSVYDGVWTWMITVSDSPLIVYYRYELPIGKWYTYLYELTTNSSRELGQLTMVGKVWQVFLFSIKESSDSYRGLSAIIDGALTTLYTGDYTTAQYLWDTIKLNNSQEIYLPLHASWS